MNKVILSGNIIGNTEKAPKMMTYFKGDENKKSVMNFFVSTLIPHAKKDDEGHYPSELHAVKAFGQNADFINQYFTGGSAITLEGYLKEEKGDAKEATPPAIHPTCSETSDCSGCRGSWN